MIVDFHSHILPSIDDGSKSVEMSLQMLQEEARQGVEVVCLTPHFYPSHDKPDRFLEKRQEAYQKLTEQLTNDLPKLVLGAEVYYFHGISQWQGLKDFAIENTNYVLIEMPMPPWTKQMVEEIDMIYSNLGLRPIMAHIDRYIQPFRTHGILKMLEGMNVLVQANASFFLEKKTSRFARKLLKQEVIHVLGSDVHNLDSRPVNMLEALEKIERKLGKEEIDRIEFYNSMVFKNK